MSTTIKPWVESVILLAKWSALMPKTFFTR
jgi:hypothetical protein